ncbi:T9SS type A sorting domain-containing protein [bacterium]|nr:T9SS type A sorting domain-containing protein [bacterium]
MLRIPAVRPFSLNHSLGRGLAGILLLLLVLLFPQSLEAQESVDALTPAAAKASLHMRIMGGTSLAGSPVPIWLSLENYVDSIPPFSFVLSYDTSLMKLTGIDQSDGLLLNGVQSRITPVGAGHRIEFLEGKRIPYDGILCHLVFQTADPDTLTCGPLHPYDLQIDTSKYALRIDSSAQCLFPRNPNILCSISAPRGIHWSEAQQRYDPDSILVSMQVSNNGSREATGAMARLSYDTTAFTLVSPAQSLQPMTPDIVPVDGKATAEWILRAKPRAQRDTLDICAIATFANTQGSTCCTKMNVPAVGTVLLNCDLSVQDILIDTATGLPAPMPFIVTGTVYNPGSKTVYNAQAKLKRELYSILAFSGPDFPGNDTKLTQPSTIPPGGSATVQWEMRQRLERFDKSHTLSMEVLADTGWSESCTMQFTVPGAEMRLDPISITPGGTHTICQGDSIELDAGAGWQDYSWSNGSKSRYCTAKSAGIYTVIVGDSLGRIAFSDSVTIMHYPVFHPGVTVTGGFKFCPGDTVLLTANRDSTQYRWSTGDTTRSIIVTKGGNYNVYVRGPYGCWGRSAMYGIEEKNPPPVPPITRIGDTLRTVDALTWQWYLDGQPIPNGTGRSHFILFPGSYTVYITDTSGCGTMSLPFAVTVLGLDAVSPHTPQLNVYPDPSNGSFTVTLQSEGTQSVTLTLYNTLGKQVWQDTQLHFTNQLTRNVLLPAIPPGSYILTAQMEGMTLRRRVIVQ